MTDLPTLREETRKLRKNKAERGVRKVGPPPMPANYVAIILNALDNSLAMIGRTGSQTIHQIFLERYGLRREDIVMRPGVYMTVLKEMLGTAASVLELSILRDIEEQTGVKASSVKEAVGLLELSSQEPGES